MRSHHNADIDHYKHNTERRPGGMGVQTLLMARGSPSRKHTIKNTLTRESSMTLRVFSIGSQKSLRLVLQLHSPGHVCTNGKKVHNQSYSLPMIWRKPTKLLSRRIESYLLKINSALHQNHEEYFHYQCYCLAKIDNILWYQRCFIKSLKITLTNTTRKTDTRLQCLVNYSSVKSSI